jgi:Flp pilus assembly protein TadG
MSVRNFHGPERGAELLEFALVMAILLTLMLGIIWFARAYSVHQTLTRAAREGARVAAMPSSFAAGNAFADPSRVSRDSSSVFANQIAPVLRSANLDPNKVTGYAQQVDWLNASETGRQCGVVISFSYPFRLEIPFTGMGLTTISLTAKAQMRRENQPATGTCP